MEMEWLIHECLSLSMGGRRVREVNLSEGDDSDIGPVGGGELTWQMRKKRKINARIKSES